MDKFVIWMVVCYGTLLLTIRAQNNTSPPPSCFPTTPNHSDLTGEALYKQEQKDYATWIQALSVVAAAHPNTTIGNSTGVYLSRILQLQQGSSLVVAVAAGNLSITPGNCPDVALNIVNAIDTILQSASINPIIGWNCTSPFTCCDHLEGEAKYQYILNELGLTLQVTLVEGKNHASAGNTEKWLQNLIDFYHGLTILQTLLGQKDFTTANWTMSCVATVKDVARTFSTALSSLQDTNPYR